MKLATFAMSGAAPSYGVVRGDRIVVPSASFRRQYPSLRSVLGKVELLARETGDSAKSFALNSVRLLPPIPAPDKIICVGINYVGHREETGRAESAYPAIFVRFADSQIGSLAPIVRPRISHALDFEGELAVIIGGGGRYIERERALEHVAGYSCYNDVSVRDWQRHTHQFTPGKNFPNTGAFGPWLVTADEIPDPGKLLLTTRLNGDTVQHARTADMIFSVPEIIAYVSSFTKLTPGDVIATGTPGGVGFKRTPPLYLKAGDEVAVEISLIGTLRNCVIEELETDDDRPLPQALHAYS